MTRTVNSDLHFPAGPKEADERWIILSDRMDSINSFIREEENRHEEKMGDLIEWKEEVEREMQAIANGEAG